MKSNYTDAQKQIKKSQSQILTNLFLYQLKVYGIQRPSESEYRFHQTRKWRFDFAYPKQKIAIEIDGGTFIQGRHTNPIGYANDREKLNEAQLLGWSVFCFTTDQIKNGYAIEFMRRIHMDGRLT